MMNNRTICLTVLLWLLTFSVQSQLLWRVTGNGLTKSSYLFGTHHLIESDQIPAFDSILFVCRQTETVVGEMDLKEPGIKRKMMSGAVMKDTKIKDLVSAADYQLLDSEFKSIMGVGMSVLGGFKPMMLMSLHQLMLYMRCNQLKSQPVAVDEVFQKQARSNKMHVVGLETLDMQMNILFNTISYDRQAEILMYEVREKDQMLTELKQLNEVYVSGNLEKMKQLDVDDESMKPEERKLLIEDRNENWLKQLPTLFSKQSCFVAVGCMHLVGDQGLINQLQKRGYTVQPVRF